MIIAIILADRADVEVQGQSPYLLPLKDETVIERVARVVLRGPFGATVVASRSGLADEIRENLEGFALQHATLPEAPAGSVAALKPALKFANDFRARWEKIRAAAAERFGSDDSEEDHPKKSRKTVKEPRDARKSSDLSRHSGNADVKVRGLVRSFERDGVMLFRGDSPLIRAELQAQMVEAFARSGLGKEGAARPFAQAVAAGTRGYPMLLDTQAVSEVLALPAETVFDDWLLDQLRRVQDVPVQDPGALTQIQNETDYKAVLSKI